MKPTSKIFIAGARGLVGSAVARRLKKGGHARLLSPTRQELDLLDQRAVHHYFNRERPEYVFLCAAKAGGILANQKFQTEFLYENLLIAANLIHAAAENGTSKLLYLGTSCIYPKLAPQPIREDALLSGPLESTNEGYALAKIAGLKLCEKYNRQYGKRFICAMPTNLYGPGDNFHPDHSHVIPGMMRRFHEAKNRRATEVSVWGTGTPKREFLHVDDLADALYLLMQKYDAPEPINVGTGEDLSIAELAQTMKTVTGFAGNIKFDPTKPDGTPRKVLDVSRIRALGWKHQHSLTNGLKSTYEWAQQNRAFLSS